MYFKKFIAILSLFVFMTLPTISVEAADKSNVAVMPFINQSARKSTSSVESAIKNAYADVAQGIEDTDRFKTVTRDQDEMEKLLMNMSHEHESGLYDLSTIAQYGKYFGAQYLVLGTVTELAKEGDTTFAYLSLRMIKVETAEIFLSGRGKGKSSKGERDAMEKAVKDALNGKSGMITMFNRRGK